MSARAAKRGGSGGSGEAGTSLLIHNARLVDRDIDCVGSLLVRDGVIVAVGLGRDACQPPDGTDSGVLPEVLDASGAVLMPAFVDLHAHFRDPGMTRKEDLESGSRAAVAGGYATVVLMANTEPACSDAASAACVRARARAIGLVDAFQTVSLTRDLAGAELTDLASLDRREVPVVSEDGREVASAARMLEAMRRAASSGVVVSCHCEDADLASLARELRREALSAGLTGSAARPLLAEAHELLALAEDTMTVRNLEIASRARCRVHLAHVSTARSLEFVRRAKAAWREKAASPARPCPVSCEVTPHHLALTDELPAIVNPPLRGEADRLALIAGILDGTVDAIATDHAPHTAEDKASGAPGFTGIQTAFSVVNTALVRAGHIGLSSLSSLMSASPAAILGLNRGLLRPGMDADFVLVDPDGEVRYGAGSGEPWFSKGLNSPFLGTPLHGIVLATFRAGSLVYRRP